MNGYELLEQWRESDKLEDKIKLAKNGNEADIDDLLKDPRWSQCKEIKKAAIILYGANLDKFVQDPDEDIRAAVASKWRSKDLDILVRDPSVKVRTTVAAYADQSMHTKKLFDILVGDESPEVRAMVAQMACCYGTQNNPYLDKLVHDPSADVRAIVARYSVKKYLDILVNDPDEDVRATVVWWGHRPKDLNKLVKDPSPFVRKAVAMQGRDRNLEKLINDPDEDVRRTACKKVREKEN